MVTVQFSTQRAFDSALIRFFTWSDISHCDLVTDKGWFLGARMSGGVQLRPPTYTQFAKIITAHVDADYQAVMTLAMSQLGKPYDWAGIVNFGRQRNWRSLNSWFCSELIAWAFEKAGYPLLNIGNECWRVTPRDLLLSPRVIVEAH